MPNERPGQPRAETSQPSGWILCLLYGLVVAPLMAGEVVLIDSFPIRFLGIEDASLGQIGSALAKVVLLSATLTLVFLAFRRIFALRRLKLTALAPLYFASTGWVLAITAFSYAMILGAARHLGHEVRILEDINWVLIFIAVNLVGSFPLMTFLEQHRPEPDDGDGTVTRP